MSQATYKIKPVDLKDLLESALDGNDTVVLAQCILVHPISGLIGRPVIKRLFAIAHLNGLYSVCEAANIRRLGEIASMVEGCRG